MKTHRKHIYTGREIYEYIEGLQGGGFKVMQEWEHKRFVEVQT